MGQSTGIEDKNGYNIIIKQDIQVKLITSKSDYICLSHCPMRLVHRRNNPNKETLIHIPLSHATVIQAYRIRVAKHMVIITRIHNKKDMNHNENNLSQ